MLEPAAAAEAVVEDVGLGRRARAPLALVRGAGRRDPPAVALQEERPLDDLVVPEALVVVGGEGPAEVVAVLVEQDVRGAVRGREVLQPVVEVLDGEGRGELPEVAGGGPGPLGELAEAPVGEAGGGLRLSDQDDLGVAGLGAEAGVGDVASGAGRLAVLQGGVPRLGERPEPLVVGAGRPLVGGLEEVHLSPSFCPTVGGPPSQLWAVRRSVLGDYLSSPQPWCL